MGLWDFVRTAIIVEGIDHMLNNGKKIHTTTLILMNGVVK
jgi:hypothetical protein